MPIEDRRYSLKSWRHLVLGAVVAAAGTHAAADPPCGADPTGTNVRIWGDWAFNRALAEETTVSALVSSEGDWGHDTFEVALAADGALTCWGGNRWGQCEPPAELMSCESTVLQIEAGGAHVLALLDDGSVRSWGWGDHGQTAVPAVIEFGAIRASGIAAGARHSVAILEAGGVICWGHNGYGECMAPAGLGENGDPVVKVAAGYGHSVALLASGRVVAWGCDDLAIGQWPNDGQCDVPEWIGAPGLRAVDVAAGPFHTVVALEDGRAVSWGRLNGAPDGVGDLANPVTQVAATTWGNVALRADGTLVAWTSDGPLEISGVELDRPIASIAGGVYCSVVYVDGGMVRFSRWPWADPPGLPRGMGDAENPAIDVSLALSGRAVSLLRNGTVACRVGSPGACDVPDGLAGPETPETAAVAVAAGSDFTLALLADGSIRSWGAISPPSSKYGDPLPRAAAIDAGNSHAVAVMIDGSVICWGGNLFEQDRVPGFIGPQGDPAKMVAAGGDHTVALLASGRVVCWGRNTDGNNQVSGQCNPPDSVSNPDDPTVQVAAGSLHSMALLESGNVICWGNDSHGECVVPDEALDPDNPAVQIAAGDMVSGARLADGTIVVWGFDRHCQRPERLADFGAKVIDFDLGGGTSIVALDWRGECSADLDGDGVVGGNDLGRLFAEWGRCRTCDADLDGDGFVGGSDLGAMFSAWGSCP